MEYKRIFDVEMDELKRIIMRMGETVQKQIRDSVLSLARLDKELAESVIETDRFVDRLELAIDEKCIELVALRQPEAGDLRFLMTGMGIATDLERIGDLAEDIGRRAIDLSQKTLVKSLDDIPKMGELAEESVSLVLRAFLERNSGMAMEVWRLEKESDVLRDRVAGELVALMTEKPKVVSLSLPLLFVSRDLERICDHATNIAEDIIYMAEGRVLKHRGGERTRILFVCVENSARSQMAEGFASAFGGPDIEAFSAGSKPTGEVDPDAMLAMREVGIDISKNRSKGFQDLPADRFDYVVTLGCHDVCPYFPAKKQIDWQIDDPKGKGIDAFRAARDVIKEKVEALLRAL